MKVILKKKEDKKKVYALVGLAVVAAYLLYSNFGSSDQPAAAPVDTSARAATPATDTGTSPVVPRRGITSRASAEFRPRFGSKRPEDRIDPNKVDPTLRLDLLAKVQTVTLEGGARNLFQFGVAAPVVTVDKSPIPKVPKIPVMGPATPPSVNVGSPPVASAPPIPLKYYGFTNTKGEPRKKAFFLDGEEIIVAWEGETVKSRYKIVRIGVNSIDMEDTQFKSKQTLPLEPEPAA